MSGAFRYAFQPSDVALSPQVLQPFSLGIFTAAPHEGGVSVRRGSFEGFRKYKLPYRLWTPASPKAGLILLHGAFDYAGAFDAFCPLVAARGFAALTYDQRGFGQTRTRGRWTGGKKMARDVAAAVAFLRARIGNVPIFLVGESMGGAIAVRAVGAGMVPDVAGMVLVAPGALASNMKRVFYSIIARILRALGARAEVFVQRIRGDELSADATIRLLADPLVLRRISPSIFSGLFNAACDAVDYAAKVRIPSLTLVGSREDVTPLACVRKLHRRLGGDAAWQEFIGGPHMLLHWEKSEIVLEHIFAWLESQIGPLQIPMSESELHKVSSQAAIIEPARLAQARAETCA